MVFYLERLGGALLLAAFIFGFSAVFFGPSLLKKAFFEIGRGHLTDGQRLSIFLAVFKHRVTCAKLQDNDHFRAAIFLLRASRIFLAGFFALYVLVISLKALGLN